jgi:hypothetical protein
MLYVDKPNIQLNFEYTDLMTHWSEAKVTLLASLAQEVTFPWNFQLFLINKNCAVS